MSCELARVAILSFLPLLLLAQTPALPPSAGPSLPAQALGPEDVVSIQVLNFPEFSRTVRIAADGAIALPLVRNRIIAGGKLPAELESTIANTLRAEDLVVNPTVTVTVVEYTSRPISIFGAVKNPITFQAIGRVTLMDAIIRAGGFAPDAGPEVLVSKRPAPGEADSAQRPSRHISVRALLSSDENEANIVLGGNDEVRVPPAGRMFVLGDVRTPGAFPVQDLSDTTVMKALSLSGGTGSFPSREAYIIRRDEATGTKHKIPIALRAILDRKAPDFPMLPDDILFVPDDRRRKDTLVILDRLLTFGAAIGSGLIIYTAGR